MSSHSLPGAGARLAYLDGARSVLMLLGVVLHAALAYAPHGQWLIADRNQHPFFDWLVEIIHLFRMPAFFAISGFFCAMTLSKLSRTTFLRKRLLRIGAPLLTTALLLNVPLSLLLSELWPKFSPEQTDYWLHGRWVMHLWFLWTLILFFLLTTATVRLWQPLLRRHHLPAWGLLLLPLLTVIPVAVAKVLPAAYQGVLWLGSPYEWLRDGIWFGLGLILFHWSTWLRQLTTATWSKSGASAVIVVGFLFASASGWLHQENLLGKICAALLSGAAVLASVHLCLSFFHWLFPHDRPWLRRLADSAYSVYLLHHPIAVLLAWALLPLSLPHWQKYALVLVPTVTISLLLHQWLVLRVPLLRFLLNGVRSPGSGQAHTLAATSNPVPAQRLSE